MPIPMPARRGEVMVCSDCPNRDLLEWLLKCEVQRQNPGLVYIEPPVKPRGKGGVVTR